MNSQSVSQIVRIQHISGEHIFRREQWGQAVGYVESVLDQQRIFTYYASYTPIHVTLLYLYVHLYSSDKRLLTMWKRPQIN